jgi:DNA-binding HxlR family transcriptional regulator
MPDRFDRVIHQPIRTKIMAHLITTESCDFTGLRNMLTISDGNLSTHIKELVAHNYISVEKAFVDNKPKTTYRVTADGRTAFYTYVQSLRTFVMSF